MGTGSAIAHRAVDSMMGPRTVVHEQAPAPAAAAAPAAGGEACINHRKSFYEVSRYGGSPAMTWTRHN